MSSGNVKMDCAKAALGLIKNGMVIGLGGGSTISYLIDFISEEKDLNVKIVTPSFKTKLQCLKKGLKVLHTFEVDHIDVAFDGCDEVDENFNALKSNGGIHTQEKLIASMAEDFILLVDNSKYVKKLTFGHPVVLEILENSMSYVLKKTEELKGKPVLRSSNAKDGATISDNGHLLVDVFFEDVKDISKLGQELINICGVIDHSLFSNLVSKVLVAGDEGIQIISNNQVI